MRLTSTGGSWRIAMAKLYAIRCAATRAQQMARAEPGSTPA
jgi:hypothetical protein